MIWPFKRKSRNPEARMLEAAPPRPPGSGWRQWFELSARAAADPPWNYEMVEIWRPDWTGPRLTRSADLPHELDGPGYWWRPRGGDAGGRSADTDTSLLIDNQSSPSRLDTE